MSKPVTSSKSEYPANRTVGLKRGGPGRPKGYRGTAKTIRARLGNGAEQLVDRAVALMDSESTSASDKLACIRLLMGMGYGTPPPVVDDAVVSELRRRFGDGDEFVERAEELFLGLGMSGHASRKIAEVLLGLGAPRNR